MWRNTRFANWEVEGQVRERVNKALIECEQDRLAKSVRVEPRWHVLGQFLAAFCATLARLFDRAADALDLWLDTRRPTAEPK